MRNFGRKFSILGKYRGRIEILSTHNLFCEKFAYVSDSDSIRVYI